jgi:hypothetical protein
MEPELVPHESDFRAAVALGPACRVMPLKSLAE